MTVAQIAEMLQSDIVFSHPDRECRHALHKALAMFSMAAMLQVCVCGWVARCSLFSFPHLSSGLHHDLSGPPV